MSGPTTGMASAVSLAGVRVCVLRTGPYAHDKRTIQVAAHLADAGAAVTVVCVAPSASRYETDGGVSVVETWPGDPSTHPWRPVRIALNVLRMWRQHRALVRLARCARPDVVHCMNVDTLTVGRAVRSARLVYDAREHFATTGVVRWYVRRWWGLAERRGARGADAVLTVSDPIAEDLAQRYSIARPVVIYNGCTRHVEAATHVHVPLRLIHLGKFFPDRNLEEIIDAMAAFRGRAVLALQGWGVMEASLRAKVADRELDDVVTFLPPVEPEAIAESIAEHDVGLFNIRPETQNLAWSAGNKLFEYLAAGLAVAVPEGLTVSRDIVRDADCGVVFEDGRIKDAIRYCVDHPEDVLRLKRNAIIAADRYSWNRQGRKLLEVYAGLTERLRPGGDTR